MSSAARTKLSARLASAVSDLKEIDEDLRTKHTAAQTARRKILRAIEPRATLKQTLSNLVDVVGQRYRNEQALQVAQSLSAHDHKPSLPMFASLPLTLIALAGLMPDLVKASLSRLIDEAKFDEGLPVSARAQALELVDAEITALQQEQSELVAEAASLGVTIEEFPETVAARRRVAEQEARDEAARLAHERSLQYGQNPLLLNTTEVMRPADAGYRH